MLKQVKKFISKHKTASLTLSVIAVSLFVGLSIPSAQTPSINEICFDWDPNCTITRQTKTKAKKAASQRSTYTPVTPTEPTINDRLPEEEFNPPPSL